MASCEKCWEDAGGNPDKYSRLIKLRADNPCSPEDQAGEGAEKCPTCGKFAIHIYCHECMACHYKLVR